MDWWPSLKDHRAAPGGSGSHSQSSVGLGCCQAQQAQPKNEVKTCRHNWDVLKTASLFSDFSFFGGIPYNCVQISICNRQTAALHLVKWRVYLLTYGSKLLRIVDPPILPHTMDQADLQKRPAIWVCLKKGCPQIFTIQHIQLVIVSLSDYRHLWQVPFARCILHTYPILILRWISQRSPTKDPIRSPFRWCHWWGW